MSLETRHTPAGAAITTLIGELFALHGHLVAASDERVEDLGITHARLEALAGVAALPAPEPVARLARLIGMSRQNLQRLVSELEIDRLVQLEENPHHKRAPLVLVTSRGRRVLAEAERRQIPWANVLARGLSADEIATALRVVRTLRTRLDNDEGLFG